MDRFSLDRCTTLKIHVRPLRTDSGAFVEFRPRRLSGCGAMRPRSGPFGREHANPEKIEKATNGCTQNVPNSRTVSLVSHVPLPCKTFGVDCSSCRAATMITLTYSCPSCSKLYPHLGRLLVACRSLQVLTVIVKPLLGRFACFVVIFVRFRRCRV